MEYRELGGGVFLGAHSIVIGNVEIGEGSNVGAGCVVTKDVPPRCTAIGNPMRIIKSEY